MPAKDKYHNAVRNALVKNGWTFTHDPFHLEYGGDNMFVDLGAEKLVAAEKDGQKIAVGIKGFGGPSEVAELEKAVGQFTLYRFVLEEREPNYTLFLAVPEDVLKDTFQQPLGRLMVSKAITRLIGFDPVKESITQWIS